MADTLADEAKFFTDGLGITGYYDMMKERMRRYRKSSPGDNWDGIFMADSK